MDVEAGTLVLAGREGKLWLGTHGELMRMKSSYLKEWDGHLRGPQRARAG